MSFFRSHKTSNVKLQIKKQTLRARILNKLTGKRMSRFLSASFQAGMAVEASLAVPVFLFFILNILSAFSILQLYGTIAGALHQVGNKMAYYGYAYDSGLGEWNLANSGLSSMVLSEGYARRQVIDFVGERVLEKSCLSGGSGGLRFLQSSIMEQDDIIELVASYKVTLFANMLGLPELPMENRYYGRAWTGYDVEKRGSSQGEDAIVFVTKSGTVYHLARNCSYLNPSIQVVSSFEVDKLRSVDGKKYYACNSCNNDGIQSVVYITDYGSKYHIRVRCPGLKRTIYTIRRSETNGLGQCSKCGE